MRKNILDIILIGNSGKLYKAKLDGQRIGLNILSSIIGKKLSNGDISSICENWIKSQKTYKVNYFDDFDIS